MQTESLFGDQIPGPSAMSDEELARQHRRFDDSEIKAVLEDVPQTLMWSLIDSLRGFQVHHHEEAGVQDLYGETVFDSNKGRLSAKGRLIENLAWAFNLYSAPTVVDFDWVCRESEADPEHVRAWLSRAFATEIRDLALAVYKVYPTVARRIQQRMRGWVDIDLPLH